MNNFIISIAKLIRKNGKEKIKQNDMYDIKILVLIKADEIFVKEKRTNSYCCHLGSQFCVAGFKVKRCPETSDAGLKVKR